MGFCSMGTPDANKTSPSGSIHSPRIGKKLKIPPTISRMASGIRTSREDGLRSHPTNLAGPGGSLASNQAKCRSISALESSLNEFLPVLTGDVDLKRRRKASG